MDSKYHQNKQHKKIKPVQFISFDANKNIQINPDAINIITSFKQKCQQLCVVAVVGKYRTGKSYILNRVLLNQNSGFEVGPTINACTKGLWIWPHLVEINNNNGSKTPTYAMIMDTEGLGSLQQGENTDTKIFLMATLLSSYMLYNSMGSIDQKAVQSLALIVNLGKMISKSKNQRDIDDIVNCFPSFMWLVRDFSLRLQNQYGEIITSKEYLQNALKQQKGNSEMVQKKNKIRTQLREFFRERDCFTLIRPTLNEKQLQHLNTLSDDRIRPEFLNLISQLKTKIFNKVKPKMFKGKPCSPLIFLEMCKYFANAINEGGIPSISSHWQIVCKSESNKIIKQFQQKHQAVIKEKLMQQISIDQLELIHKKIIAQGQKKIDQTFLSLLEKQLKKKQLKKKLKSNFEGARRSAVDKKFEQIKSIIQSTFIDIINQVRVNKFENFYQVVQKFEKIPVEHSQTADTQIYKQFYSKMKNISNQYIKAMQQKWRTQNILLKQKQQFFQKSYAERKFQLQAQIQQYYEKLRYYEVQNYKITMKYETTLQQKTQLMEEIQQMRQCHQANLEQLNKQRNNLVQKYEQQRYKTQNRIQQLNMLLNKKQIECQSLSQQNKNKERQIENEKKYFDQSSNNYRNTIQQLEQKINNLEFEKLQKKTKEESKILKNQNQNQLNQIINDLNFKIIFLQKQKQNLNKELKNQKQMNESLIKFVPNHNTVILKQLQKYQKQNQQLLKCVKKYKSYEKLIISCQLFKCNKCKNSHSLTEYIEHMSQCQKKINIKPQFDVSFTIDSFSKDLIFTIDVQFDKKTWKLQKSCRMIDLLIRKLKTQTDIQIDEDIQWNQETEGLNENQIASICQQKRMNINNILNVIVQKNALVRNQFLIQFLGFDIHDKPTRQDQISPFKLKQNFQYKNINYDRNFAKRKLKFNDNLKIEQEDQEEQDMKENMLKTCKFQPKKFMFNF